MEAAAGCVSPASGVVINDLPDEVLIRILSYSTLRELIYVTQKVCSRWKLLSHDPELWRDKKYSIGYGCSGDEVVLILQQMPQLRTLVVDRGVGSSVIEAVCDHCNNLTTLELRGCREMTISLLEMLVQKCGNIQSLRILGQFLSTERMSQTLAQLNHLQSLSILGDYSTCGLVHLRPFAERCLQLSRLKLDKNIGISYEDMGYFFNLKCKTLTHITLPWVFHNQRCIVPLLRDCTSLSYLELTDCREVGGEAAEAFTALGCLTNLHTLIINDLHSYPVGAPTLAFESGGLSRLQVLDAKKSDLDDSALLAVYMHCPELKELHLSGNSKLTNAGLRQLYRLSKLELLDLSGCLGLRRAARVCPGQLAHLLCLDRVTVFEESDLETILNLTSLKVLRLNGTVIANDSFLDRIPENLVNLRCLEVWHIGMHDALDRLQERMPGLQIDRDESYHNYDSESDYWFDSDYEYGYQDSNYDSDSDSEEILNNEIKK